MADATIPGGGPPTPPTGGGIGGIDLDAITNWAKRFVDTLIEDAYNREENAAKLAGAEVAALSEARAVVTNAIYDALAAGLKKVSDFVTAGTPLAGELSAHVMNQIAGLNLDTERIGRDFTGAMTQEGMRDIGAQFSTLLDKMFPIASSATGEKDRADRGFALDNLHAYFGTNMNFQLRSLAIGSLASLVPFIDLRHFEGLHQSINWAYGFGWLSWSVLSAIMSATTTKPLTEYYNQRIKGNDLSESEALHAFVQKRISQEVLNKVLDNQGMRDDIRGIRIDQTRTDYTTEQAVRGFIEGHITPEEFNRAMDAHGVRDDIRQKKVDMARPDLSESDIQEGFNNGLFSERDAADHYKEKGFDGFNLQAKLNLTKDNRLFKFRERLEAAYFHGYVIGTVTQQEFTQYLSSINYTGLEIDMEIRRAEIMMRSHAQKHLTRAEILRLVADGGMEAPDAIRRLVDQGLPDADARRLIADAVLKHAVSMVPPKIRNECLSPQVEQNLLTAAIQVVTQIDPQYAIVNKDFWAQAQCILQQYTSGGGTGGPQPPAAPQGLAAFAQPGAVVLTWFPVAGVQGYQVYRREQTGLTFFATGVATTAQNYIDTAVTAQQTYVYAVRSILNGVESGNSNEVTATVP